MQTVQIVYMIVGTLLPAFGFPLLCYQLWLQHRQSKFQALTELHREVLLSPMRDGLRNIYKRVDDNKGLPEDKQERGGIELVLDTYDLVGFRVAQSVLPRDATLETEWSVVWRVWKKMSPFIMAERTRRNAPYYKSHLERFAGEAEEYRKSKGHENPEMCSEAEMLSDVPRAETNSLVRA